MTLQEYQNKGIPLETLTLNVLRGIDIRTPDEEKIIQELVNKKLQRAPIPVVINRPTDKTDFKTKEQELEFQKVIDERVASARPQEEKAKLNRFCEFCTSKGVKHLKICNRPK